MHGLGGRCLSGVDPIPRSRGHPVQTLRSRAPAKYGKIARAARSMTLNAHIDAIASSLGEGDDPVVVLAPGDLVAYANAVARAVWSLGDKLDPTSPFGAAVTPHLPCTQSVRFEWGEQGAAGVKSWYACSLRPIRDHDAVLGWLCVATDVVELKRSEERLRRSEQLMVDTHGVAHLGTWDWDVSQPHAHWSAELYRIYGLAPESYTPSYEAYLKMVHPDDRQRVIDATNRVFHEHIPYSHDERIFRPDGSMRYLHTWAYPILDANGRLSRLVGVCQDITDRAEAEEKVLRLNADLERRVAERTRQLEASVRDLEAFNAMLSHDIRGPLQTIRLSVDAMSRTDVRPAETAKARQRVDRSVTQMMNLVDDLLAFARIGNVTLNRTDVDLTEMAHEIFADLRESSPERKVHVTIQPGVNCFADRGLMRVAFANLIRNAWKYTARVHSASISVECTVVAGKRVLAVRDNGAGFDMKDAHRLFAPFQRLHSEREFAGTGIGLASVQRILDRHGSKVWAEGTPGIGASFFVELPDHPSADVAAAENGSVYLPLIVC